MNSGKGVLLNFGDVVIDCTSDGNVVVRYEDQQDETVTVFLLRHYRGEWLVDLNTIAMDDVPLMPSLLTH